MSYNNRLKWCIKQKNGIHLIEPNEDVCAQYLNEAEKDIITMEKVDEKWEAVTAYYACYNSLCALLHKAGIKSEIHECTIALMELVGYQKGMIEFLKNLKINRINVQYYLKKPEPLNKDTVKRFVELSKKKISELTSDNIKQIRAKIKEAQNEA